MKKALLCFAAVAAAVAGRAQSTLTLSGSSYFQSFDNIGSGMPTGWEIDSAATATSKGIAIAFDQSATAWINPSTAATKAKNFAAKNGFTVNNTPAATQASATNRALGIRQVGTIDSQIAFTLTLTQTTGLTNFNLVFNLQSLDSTSPRLSTWAVQYGIGANPTSFTTVNATGTNGLTTGNNTFSNSVVTASFGSALNNQSGPVVIRIINQNKTSGTGTRASTGLDSLTLSWSGAAVNNQPQIVTLSPANNATGVAASSNLSVTFDKNITAGPGNIYIRNVTDGVTTTKAATSSDVTISGMMATIANVGLQNGKSYRITFDSTAFKNGTASSTGIYDTTLWRFTTLIIPQVVTVTSLNENWDAACTNNALPNGWSRQNVAGPGQQWQCYSTAGGNALMEINGFANGANNVNEDWLITPKLDLTGYSNPGLRFKMNKRFTGDEMDVVVSSNYDGLSAPSTATWTSLNIPMLPSDTSISAYRLYSADLTSKKATPFFIAFKYVSSATSGYRVRIDTVTVIGTQGIEAASAGAQLPVTVLGAATTQEVVVAFAAETTGQYTLSLVDLTGREVARQTVAASAGSTPRVVLQPAAIAPGLYLVRVSNGTTVGVTKASLR